MTKVVFNSVVNTICTLFEIQMGQFIDYPGAERLSKQLINEAYDVTERAGIKLLNDRETEWKTVEYVSRVGNPLHYPSMYEATTHDFLRGLVHLAENTRKFRQ